MDECSNVGSVRLAEHALAERPPARIATQLTWRAREDGRAKAAVTRRAWTKRVETNVAIRSGGAGRGETCRRRWGVESRDLRSWSFSRRLGKGFFFLNSGYVRKKGEVVA